MFDHSTHPANPGEAVTAHHQRATGRASVRLGSSGRIAGLHQSGCAKAFLPQVGGRPEVVFLNTAGGLTGGDTLDFSLDIADGIRATGTTQTAERAYASATGSAKVTCRLSAGAGASLEWLPQETILFDASSLDRVTEVELAADADLLFCEALVLGRAAMGETVQTVRLRDERRVMRHGRPVILDPVAFDSSHVAKSLPEERDLAGFDGARAFATLALVANGAEAATEPLRDALGSCDGVRTGVSGWNGRCIVRIAASDGWPLRRALASAIRHLRGGQLPRVWQI